MPQSGSSHARIITTRLPLSSRERPTTGSLFGPHATLVSASATQAREQTEARVTEAERRRPEIPDERRRSPRTWVLALVRVSGFEVRPHFEKFRTGSSPRRRPALRSGPEVHRWKRAPEDRPRFAADQDDRRRFAGTSDRRRRAPVHSFAAGFPALTPDGGLRSDALPAASADRWTTPRRRLSLLEVECQANGFGQRGFLGWE